MSAATFPEPRSSSSWRVAPAVRFEPRRTLAERYANRTFALFFVIASLTFLGLCLVYSASAAIIAAKERRGNSPAWQDDVDRTVGQAAWLAVTAMTAVERQEMPKEGAEWLPRSSEWVEDLGEFGADTPSLHSASFLMKQMFWGALGFVALLVFYQIDYQTWRRWAPWLLGVVVILLMLVWAPGIGKRINGAARWVGFGPIRLQPSELAKMSLALFLAGVLSGKSERLRQFWRGFVPLTTLVGCVAMLILAEPDLGATVCLGTMVLVVYWVGGVPKRFLALMIVGAACVLAMELTVPYRRARLLAFLDPETYIKTHSWQLVQSLVAMGSGGLTGLGLGQGPQKYQFLSEAYTDFIYAVIGEELGLIGAFLVALGYVSLFVLGWRTAMRAPDTFGTLLAIGITSLFSVSAFIHMGVNTGLLPTKGLALPFVSYGGSSLLVNLAAGGILLNISKQAEWYRHGGAFGPRLHEDHQLAWPLPEYDPNADTEPESKHQTPIGERRVTIRRGTQSREVPLPPLPPLE